MREIKFKFWNNKDRLWESLLVDSNGNVYDEIGGRIKDDIVIVSYTGLRDKNGKEIFEGDIVKSNQYVFEVKIEMGLLKPFYEVEHADDGGVDLWKDRDWEIIGNICETPELLEQER